MDETDSRDRNKYSQHNKRGEPKGKKGDELRIEPTARGRKTGTRTRWLPDLDVYTEIDIPADYNVETLRRQADVNAGITIRFKTEVLPGHFETQDFVYENGIIDYVAEIAGEDALTTPVFWETERRGRDREDKPEYKVKLSCACCFSNKVQRIEHYHNSSWLEHGGSPEKASKTAFVYAIDKYLKDNNKYQKGEARIAWQDIEDCIILVSNNFSTQTSYENQTKKAITNKFVQEAMTDFLKSRLETYFIENRVDALKIAEQVLINKRSRESAEKQRLNIKKKLSGSIDISNRVEKFVDCRTRDVSRREIYIVEGDSALGSVKLSRDGEFQGIMPVRGKILNCLKADYDKIFKNDIITDLLKVLGCGVEVRGKAAKDLSAFDLDSREPYDAACRGGNVERLECILTVGVLRRAGNLLVFRQHCMLVLRGREWLVLLRLMERRRHVLGQIAVRVAAQMRTRLRDGLRVYRLQASSSTKSLFSRSAAALTAFFFSPSSTSSLCASRSGRPFRTISSIRRASRLTSAAGDFSSGRRTS